MRCTATLACCLLPAACCLLPAACCLLPAACCPLPAARCPLPAIAQIMHQISFGQSFAVRPTNCCGARSIKLETT
ncbi:hypothetical protein DF050_38315 [Burkholderia cepacia]|nr:hypothetical protein DF050_38315 [Burkholderia cepacia]